MTARALSLLACLLWANVAAASVDPVLMRDVICKAETQGEPVPKWAVGRLDPGDWGECQVRYESTWRYGKFDPQMRRTGKPSRSPGELFISEVNRAAALEIVALCVGWYPSGDAQRIGYCYTAGLRSEPGSHARKWKWAGKLAAEYERRNQIRIAKR